MHKDLLNWSRKEYKSLPWRKKRNLYTTLVSEIMLQQTTVSTVKKHYDSFLEVFPNIFELAEASEEEVCAQWQGLGYYRRARNLHKAAVSIVEEHEGEFPKTVEELKSIPGIGDYTASAIIAIGRNKPDLALDANLERVLARYYQIEEQKGPKLQKEIKRRLHEGELKIDFKKFKPRELNESLMDLGRVFCQARRVDCLICPLRSGCLSYKNEGSPLELPRDDKKKKTKAGHELLLLRVVVKKGNQILGFVKDEKEWLSGQIEIPTFVLKTTDSVFKQYPMLKTLKTKESLPTIKTAITKYKIQNQILELSLKEFQELTKDLKDKNRYKYFKLNVQDHHFSTTTLKVLRKIHPEVNI